MKLITDEVPDEQTDLAPRRTHDRDDDQKTIDKWTAELVAMWDAGGKPGEESYAGPTRRFATDDGPDAKRRVARAFALINHDRPAGSKVAALWFKNSKPDGEGYITVKYGVRVQPAKEAAQEIAQEAATDNAGQTGSDGGDTNTPPFEPTAGQPSGDDESGRGFRRGRR